MTKVKTSDGQIFQLGPLLGKGGEGDVYHVVNNPHMAIKLYKKQAAERKDKIHAIVANKYHELTSYVAFPIDTLFDLNNTFIGFTMRKMTDVKPIHMLYAPSSRKQNFPHADFRFLLRTALNIARAVADIHTTGCVIGDINQSGILISNRATVTFIDSDSFQITLGSLIYRCPVGVVEYTPPELQGSKLETIDRTCHHDTFGLSVVVFLLLFMGWHPFSGRYLGSGEMPIEKAIREKRFAYSTHQHIQMQPPRFAPRLTDLPRDITDSFEQAFIGSPSQRPSAAQWVDMLQQMENNLIPCQVTLGHHYSLAAPSCPWCRLDSLIGKPLFLTTSFSTVVPTVEQTLLHPTTFDVTKVCAAINQIERPQVTLNLISLLPPITIHKRSPLTQKKPIVQNIVGFTVIIIPVIIIITVIMAVIGASVEYLLWLLAIMVVGVLVGLGITGNEQQNTSKFLKDTRDHWKVMEKQWRKNDRSTTQEI